ncbi:MAG: glutathione S-transferase family protein [Pseudomonadota bacterium]
MKLYTSRAAPNPRRVTIFLSEKSIDIPSVEIDLAGRENYSDAFVAKNPLARVPVLELDDGTYLAESLSICRFIDSMHPAPSLFGRDDQERALVDMWNRRMESEVMGNVTACFRHTHPYWDGRITQVKDWGELCRKTLDERMVWLNNELEQKPFIAGDLFTVADITAVCAFDLGRVAKIAIPESLAALSDWYRRVGERPSVVNSNPARKK